MNYHNVVFESLPPPDSVPRILAEFRLIDISSIDKMVEDQTGKITGFWLKPYHTGFRLWANPDGLEARVLSKQISLKFYAPVIANAKAFKILNNSRSRYLVLAPTPDSLGYKVWGAYSGLAFNITENPKPESGSKAWLIEAAGNAEETALSTADAGNAILGGLTEAFAQDNLITLPGNAQHELTLEGLWLNALDAVFLSDCAIPFKVTDSNLRLHFRKDFYSEPMPLRLFSASGISQTSFKIFRP